MNTCAHTGKTSDKSIKLIVDAIQSLAMVRRVMRKTHKIQASIVALATAVSLVTISATGHAPKPTYSPVIAKPLEAAPATASVSAPIPSVPAEDLPPPIGERITKSAPSKEVTAKATGPKTVSVQTGKASWYGGRFIGGKTATGERYRATDMTAAHRKLPFGTYVRVTNLANKRSTVVRINNRGPFIKGRILDLSVAAAKKLAMVNSGVANVRMEVLSSKPAGETMVF